MNKTGIDLTQGNLVKNLWKLSLPIMLSNFMQTFYNLTDAFWLGKLGENAKDAVSIAGLTFPIVFFISSFGFGFVVSGTALISQFKGANKQDKIHLVVGQFIIILTIFIILFSTINIFFIEPILRILQTPQNIFANATSYLHIIMNGMIFMFIFLSYQSIAHGLGDTFTPMVIQIISVLINVILDPFLIFGIGFSRMETLGAAYATLIARIIGAILAIFFLLKKGKDITPNWKQIRPNKEMLIKIFKISLPASLSQSITSFGFLFLQGFVNSFGTTVIAITSLGNRMTGFFMMPAMGISNALTAIVGQNIGAQKIDRVKKSFYLAMIMVMLIMFTGGILLYFFGAQFTKFFIADEEVIEIGNRMFKLMAIASFVFGILFVLNGFFNGAGKTKLTLIFNVARLWVFRIPLVYILSGRLIEISPFFGQFEIMKKIALPLAKFPYDSLWWSMVISNICAVLIAYYLYRLGTWKKTQI